MRGPCKATGAPPVAQHVTTPPPVMSQVSISGRFAHRTRPPQPSDEPSVDIRAVRSSLACNRLFTRTASGDVAAVVDRSDGRVEIRSAPGAVSRGRARCCVGEGPHQGGRSRTRGSAVRGSRGVGDRTGPGRSPGDHPVVRTGVVHLHRRAGVGSGLLRRTAPGRLQGQRGCHRAARRHRTRRGRCERAVRLRRRGARWAVRRLADQHAGAVGGARAARTRDPSGRRDRPGGGLLARVPAGCALDDRRRRAVTSPAPAPVAATTRERRRPHGRTT